MNLRKSLLYCLFSILSFVGMSAVMDAIDRGLSTLDLTTNPVTPLGVEDAIKQLVAIFAGVRPLLTALAMILPKSWATGLNAFIAALDVVTMNANPSFKAGKDV
jgi:hypothetical protein